MVVRAVGKERGNHFVLVFQHEPVFFGNTDEIAEVLEVNTKDLINNKEEK